MTFAALAEVISIGTFIPFLAVLTAPEKVFYYPALQPLMHLLPFSRPDELVIPITIVFSLFAVMTAIIRLALLWLNTKLSHLIGGDLGTDVYRKCLYQPYRVHIERNSTQISSGVGKAKALIAWAIMPLFTIVSSTITILSIIILFVSLDPAVTISALTGFGLIYVGIAYLSKKKLEANGRILSIETVHATKALYEGLGGIRDVLLDGTQEVFCEIYNNADRKLNKASVENTFAGASPRFTMEALGMVLMAGFACYIFRQSTGLVGALSLLGVMALGAQRMLPALQMIYNSWSTMKSGQSYLTDALAFLSQPLPAHASLAPVPPLKFSDHIDLNNLSFRYSPDGPWVLKNLNLIIPQGSRTGFVGITGSGKSTLLDIIMGLLEPTEGSLKVDGLEIDTGTIRSWQANIAHVPQSIYLSDSTITDNIAFGIPGEKVNMDRVRSAAEQAQIADHIDGLRTGYNTVVGERGIRLSGGQRQRIGIARSLFKNATVIIFDEATSALDNETEKAVMDAIEGLGRDLTILIIAHRLTTVKKCDQIVELKDGCIKRIGTYQEMYE